MRGDRQLEQRQLASSDRSQPSSSEPESEAVPMELHLRTCLITLGLVLVEDSPLRPAGSWAGKDATASRALGSLRVPAGCSFKERDKSDPRGPVTTANSGHTHCAALRSDKPAPLSHGGRASSLFGIGLKVPALPDACGLPEPPPHSYAIPNPAGVKFKADPKSNRLAP